MTLALYIVGLVSIVCLVVGCVRRVWQYASLPSHLRWELYPVPHEAPERAAHGGSYFEQSEWWTKPREAHRAGELRVMAAEIFAFDSVREANRTLWWRTLLFHFGMYCVVGFVVLQVTMYFATGGLFANLVADLQLAVKLLGRMGLVFIFLGSMALLRRRVADTNLRDYTHAADYVHLGFIAITALAVLGGSFAANAPTPQRFIAAAFHFDTAAQVPALLAAGLLLTFALVAYIPYSHMAHFIAKYFTYHAVRWDDRPNYEVVQSVARSLSYRPTWSATHMGADGTKTWAEIATTNPAQETRR